jgi:uroporphyrinogen-III synthase
VAGLRGNVNTRLKKLEENDWDGAIFAFAGLDRINVLPEKHIILDWMIPAPAQGAVLVAALNSDKEILKICREINHPETELCTRIERDFLRILEGGCSAPIGALATIQDGIVSFKGIVLSPDGEKKIEYTGEKKISKAKDLGKTAAQYIVERGGRKIMRSEISSEKKIRLISTKILSEDQLKPLFSGITVAIHDFIRTKPVPFRIKDQGKPMEHVVFTSQNAVKYLIESVSPKDLNFQNICCVGEKTKQIVEEKIGPVSHLEHSAKELADHLIDKNIDQIIYFCGASRRDELPKILRRHHIGIEEVVTYKTVLTSKKFTENYDGVLFFSPSGVQSFIQENKATGLTAFCIGKTTREEAEKHFKKIIISKNTDVGSVIEIVNNTYLKI